MADTFGRRIDSERGQGSLRSFSYLHDEEISSTSGTNQSTSLEVLKQEVVSLIQSFPEGVEVSKLTNVYRRVYGKRFGPLTNYGLAGIQGLLDDLGDQLCVERIYNKNMIKSLVQVNKLPFPFNEDDAPKRAICKRVIKTVRKHPEGISFNKLAETFARRFQQELLPAEFGFPSMEAFVSSLEGLQVEDGKVFHRCHSVARLSDIKMGDAANKEIGKKVIKIVKKQSEGICINKMAEIFAQRYKQKLSPTELGFPSMEAFVTSLKGLNVEDGKVFHRINMVNRLSDADFEQTCKDVVELVKRYQNGIPLSRIAAVFKQTYDRPLKKKELGFSSVAHFIDSLGNQLYVDKGQIYYRSARSETSSPAASTASGGVFKEAVELVQEKPNGIPLKKSQPTSSGGALKEVVEFVRENPNGIPQKKSQRMARDQVFKEVVELVQENPNGIPLKKLTMFFSQKYRRNLTVSKLGFTSVAAFIQSLEDELLLDHEEIIHRKHREAPAGPTLAVTKLVKKEPDEDKPVRTGTPPVCFGADSSLNSEEMTQDELLKKVKEVIKVYPAASQSITQLKNGFFLLFGSTLPLKLYMSLYENHTVKKGILSGPVVDNAQEGAKSLEPPENIKMVQPKPMPIGVNEQVVRSKTGSPLLPFQNMTVPTHNSQLTTPSHLSTIDFPALGSNLSKAEEKKLIEGQGPVFHESFYSQLREVHGANMRAAEALQEEKSGVGRRRGATSPDDVNSLAEYVIRALATEGEHVNIDRVINRVCLLSQVSSLHELRIDPFRHLPVLKELQRTIKEINMFITSMEAVSSVCTLYELSQALANLKNKKRFEELHLGPLCKIPLIHRMFKIDANTKDDDIHQIETVDILRSLRIFRRKSRAQRVDLADFLKSLADQYSCESPYELGIRIQSLGLPIATLNKATAAEHICMDRARETIQKEIVEEVEAKLFKIKKNLLDPAQGPVIFSQTGSNELRKKYVNLTASDAVLEVFINSEGIFSHSMTKTVQTFLSCIQRDRLARALFQLAICCGSLESPQDLVAKEKPQNKAEAKKAKDERTTGSLPTEAEMKSYFEECVSSFRNTITLAYLRTLEKKIVDHFKFKDFSQLQQGTFLDFIVKNKKTLQETAGGALSIDNQDPGLYGFRPCRQDVFEFIKQCGEGDMAFVEAALRCHYRIKDSRELGHGPLSFLVNCTQRQKELSGDDINSVVRYECPLLPIDSGSCMPDTVGLLGEVSRDQALASLLSAPLLQDLEEWSHWELVFQPNHGPLKDFIDKYCGKTRLLALEVSPGRLLRVTTDTSDKHFSKAAQDLDPVGTAGHLVSIVVADGIPNTPTALLANHMESALNIAVAQEDITPGEDGYLYSAVAKFVLECITLMPTRICKELLQQVFLEPLSKVLGQAKSKTLLLDAAQSNSRYLNKLHQMGLLLGITEWRTDFNNKLVLPVIPEVPLPIQSVVEDSMSDMSSVLSLNLVDNEEETVLSTSSSSHRGANQHDQGGGDDDDDDDEQMFELVSEVGDITDSSVEEEDPDREVQAEDQKSSDQPEEDSDGNEHKAIIEDIRKTEFGIGVELNEEGQNLMRKQQARLGRSLERLSTELYSKDTHFVLELIQNADDNNYPNGGEQPALTFVVEKDCITILNNECGFEEKNIRAICDVGRSTKGKHKYGYIGQKGIGFKSVFKVTDYPEIHSNGFHIKFDKTSGPMGYILPHWVDRERPVSSVAKEIAEKRWSTKIHLPLRSESHQTKNLFHDVHPSLLLFLHRLRSLTIVNEMEKHSVAMTRRDLSHNILEVAHTGGVERWLVVKKMLYPKKIKDDVESTELALAFQLSDVSSCDVKPQKQPVFAFLPLRSFGFRFIIQGDFDIPSSREDVDRDSSWNQWLRSEIPQLFVHAMDVFSQHPEFTGMGGLCYFLQFIPQPSEILDFFNPVANHIIQLLKGKACLPAKEDNEGRVEFKQPSQLAVCQDRLIQDVIGGMDLCKSLSLSYLHPALQSSLSSSLLTALGVHRLRATEIITVTCAMAKELVQHGDLKSEQDLKKLAKLLVCNFRALDLEYGDIDALLQSLKDVPMIPLANGNVVSLSSEGVFFPLSDVTQAQKDLNALYQDLSIVEPQLLVCLDELGNSQVRELLRKLNVHELEPQEVLNKHIYPILRTKAWEKKPKDIIISYLVFIKLHSQNQDYRNLGMAIPVLTNRGFLCASESKIQFSKEYGNIDLPSKLPGVEWVLLDPCYLQADSDVDGWRELFSILGVRDLLIFRKEKRTFMVSELASSLWAMESELWSKSADGVYIIEDQHCAEFHTLVTADHLSDQTKLQQRQALIKLLDANWDTGEKYSQYIWVNVLDNQGRSIRQTKSSFYHFLTQLPWVPTQRPSWENRQPITYLQPKSVFIFSTEVHRLLGSHVDYVHMEPSEFTRTIGMRNTVQVEDMIDYLKGWCTKVSENHSMESEGADFTTTVEHIHAVYLYLYDQCSSIQFKGLFQHSPAVFIEYNREDGWCSGRFYHLKEVCWSDPTGMFQRYKELIRKPDSGIQEPKLLAPFYSNLQDMKNMFNSLSVELNPSMKQYVALLEAVCESSPLATGDIVQDVSVIFAKLADKCKIQIHGEQDQDPQLNPSYCSSLKEMVSHKKVFPTKNNAWVTLARKPMIPDSTNLEKIFKSHSAVFLLNLPSAVKRAANKLRHQGKLHEKEAFSEADRELFLEICGVKRLSQCVTTEAQTESYRPCPSVQILVRQIIPYIQRFFYHRWDDEDIYSELKESGIAKQITSLSFGQVGKLYIHYRLEVSEGDPIFESEDIICLLKDKKELYIHKDHLSAKLDICRELVKLFTTEKTYAKVLESFLQGLVSCINDHAALKRFLDRENAHDLPTDEEPWEVPAPLPVEVKPETLVRPSGSVQLEEMQNDQNKEDRLVCWPPKASLNKTGGGGGSGSQAVDQVMKMWPPPAPLSSAHGMVTGQSGSGFERSSSNMKVHERTGEPPVHVDPRYHHVQSPKPSESTSHITEKKNEPVMQEIKSEDGPQQPVNTNTSSEVKPETTEDQTNSAPTAVEQDKSQTPPLHAHNTTQVPEMVLSQFQGVETIQRPPLALDNAVWTKPIDPEAVLEDLKLDCALPQTLVISKDFDDTACIGQWGEQLVFSFLTHWKENGGSSGPIDITWFNEKGESGQPCDFKLTFANTGQRAGTTTEIFVEVKTTVKRERHFIHMSANELDFALKEKERYQIYRVYSAGDAQNVRLCRIKNLAQHLHSKTIDLFLFV
ncbi:uncharacterized protein [Paramisgurnus dabryanus]|uniref:uncharacterized protein isoform X2 n=1 Tax=Paramisgurnus dabryanus TaxID=90735 RepID=UPI0031F3598A